MYHNATKTFKFDKFVNVMFSACLGSALNVLWLFVCESWKYILWKNQAYDWITVQKYVWDN